MVNSRVFGESKPSHIFIQQANGHTLRFDFPVDLAEVTMGRLRQEYAAKSGVQSRVKLLINFKEIQASDEANLRQSGAITGVTLQAVH